MYEMCCTDWVTNLWNSELVFGYGELIWCRIPACCSVHQNFALVKSQTKWLAYKIWIQYWKCFYNVHLIVNH